MSERDRRIARITSEFATTNVDPGSQANIALSVDQREEYRVLFRKLNIADGLERSPAFPGAVFFYYHCEGSAVDSDCKGYAYSEKPLAPVAGSLDKMRPGPVFEPLSSNWYLVRWTT